MWRAFFLALGVATCILGAECLVVDHFVLAGEPEATRPEERACTEPLSLRSTNQRPKWSRPSGPPGASCLPAR